MKIEKLKKNVLVCTGFLLLSQSLISQNFIWKHGANLNSQWGVYGSIGVPAPTNVPGGRGHYATWKDTSGNFWLFGGLGYDAIGTLGLLNDLWKYDLVTNQWTYIKGSSFADPSTIYGTLGVSSNVNNPGGRAASAAWADASGNLWLFGGFGYDGGINLGELNDVWKYNIASNQWTWMKGSNNIIQNGNYGTIGVAAQANNPGARSTAMFWTDINGGFWLLGGYGYNNTNNAGHLNDVWSYNTVTNMWTWVSGTNSLDVNGNYGTMGVAAPSNQPGSRSSGQAWVDPIGTIWLFGGFGFDAANNSAKELNDLWRYNTASNQWTWMKGSNNLLQNGNYGTIGVPNPFRTPGSRQGTVGWTDVNNSFLWLFGGSGLDSASQSAAELNDLWRYNILTNEWAWMKGSSQALQMGNYGTLNFQAPTNIPGARAFLKGWVDNVNNYWLFGGSGVDGSNGFGSLNDLWKIGNCNSPTLNVASTNTALCVGKAATLTVSGANSYTWNTLQTTSTISINPTVTTTYVVNSTNIQGCTSDFSFVQTVIPSPTINIISASGSFCLGKSATLTAGGANTYSWTSNQTGSMVIFTPTLAAPYSITCTATSSNGCEGSAITTLTVLPIPNLTIAASRTQVCKGEKATFTVSGAGSYSWHTTPASTVNIVIVSPTVTTVYSVTGTGTNTCKKETSITLTVDACTGITEGETSKLKFSLYPNPNNGEFIIKLDSENLKEATGLVILNAIGQKIYEQTLNAPEHSIKPNLTKGIYYYQILQSNNKVAKGKMVVD